jgi:hypothetical protein
MTGREPIPRPGAVAGRHGYPCLRLPPTRSVKRAIAFRIGGDRYPDRMAAETAPTASTVSRSRIRLARVVAWVLAVFAAVPFFGLIDLGTLVGAADPAYVWAVPLEVSWGSLFTFLVAGSYVRVAVVPRRAQPALVQLGIVVVALAVAAVGGLDAGPAVVAAGVAASGLLLGWLTHAFDGWGVKLSRDLLPVLVAVIGAALWLPYALTALERSRAGRAGELTNGIEHWPVQGATGLALAIGGAVMAVWRPARQLFRITLSLSAVFVGMANLGFPDRAGATQGLQWAVAVTVWGVLVALTPAASTSPQKEPATPARGTPAGRT